MADAMTTASESALSHIHWLIDRIEHSIESGNPMPFREFASVSESLMDGYARFVRLGLPGYAVGLAMLGATVNLFELLEIEGELPELLRGLADRIEPETNTH